MGCARTISASISARMAARLAASSSDTSPDSASCAAEPAMAAAILPAERMREKCKMASWRPDESADSDCGVCGRSCAIEPSGSPNAIRRAIEPSGSPNAIRRAIEQSSSPNAIRRAIEQSGSPNAIKSSCSRRNQAAAQSANQEGALPEWGKLRPRLRRRGRRLGRLEPLGVVLVQLTDLRRVGDVVPALGPLGLGRRRPAIAQSGNRSIKSSGNRAIGQSGNHAIAQSSAIARSGHWAIAQ